MRLREPRLFAKVVEYEVSTAAAVAIVSLLLLRDGGERRRDGVEEGGDEPADGVC
jgi:hypothetical protein